MAAYENSAYTGDDLKSVGLDEKKESPEKAIDAEAGEKPKEEQRDVWGSDIEFMFSCIALSVGLGNVWRFPFVALENGGGAFLIPYLIVLFLVGRPIYYMEMLMGQFSSRGAIQMFDFCPAMRGIGIAQILATFLVGTYYSSLGSIIAHYLFNSFKPTLPWSKCKEEWGPNCINSDGSSNALSRYKALMAPEVAFSSSEYYFENVVLKERESIANGIGVPDLYLAIGLIVCWALVFLCTFRGVSSTGKASYFLAIFPYIVLIILLIRAVTLEGAVDGILFFLTPQWEKLLDAQVWYAAVTQVFFSLTVCFGSIISYSSFNRFNQNIHRDVVVIAYLDTATSLVSGFTIFGILGNLAHNLGTTDIKAVVKGGPGLAFISYPEAISKFSWVPQVFSVLFFVMLFVLSIGTLVGIGTCVIRAVRDNFPRINQWQGSLLVSVVSCAIGLIYVTPGGQFMLNLVDNYGAAMMVLAVGILELYVLGWIYGVQRICKNTDMMIKNKPGWYWRSNWGVITPILMTAILIYSYVSYEPLKYKEQVYPTWAVAIGWTIFAIGVLQVPIFMIVAVKAHPGTSFKVNFCRAFKERFFGAFKPLDNFGPYDAETRQLYQREVEEYNANRPKGVWNFIKHNLTD